MCAGFGEAGTFQAAQEAADEESAKHPIGTAAQEAEWLMRGRAARR